jgi:hypothetical protein
MMRALKAPMSAGNERLTPQQRPERARPPAPRGFLGHLLYIGFWLALLVPQVRRWRRQAYWSRVRLAVAATAAALTVAGFLTSSIELLPLGVGLLLLAAWLAPVASPYALQETAARWGADYVLHGGSLDGRAVILLLTRDEILVLPADEPTPLLSRIALAGVTELRIGGEPYRPNPLPSTKEPPVRERSFEDTDKVVELELMRGSGEPLRLVFQGAFAAHLAEVAAHTLLSVKTLPQALRIVSPAKPQKSFT